MGDSKVFGNYRLDRMIGHGAMGAVYLAEEQTSGEKVALKVLPTSVATNAEYTRRFLNEARVAQQLDHPHIVRVRDFGKMNGHHYMAMDYVDGESCRARISRDKRLPWPEAVSVAIQAAEGLAAASAQGIIHRDIKPENLLIDRDGRVRIADLGLAKQEGVAEPLPSDTSLGTPDYMSPEQVNNSETVDFRSDVYSLGAALFHMIAGKAPYTGRSAYEVMVKHVSSDLPSVRRYVPDLAQEVCDVMRKMMAQEPADRYQSYGELLSDLRALLAGQPVVAREFDKESLISQNGTSADEASGRRVGTLLLVAVPVLLVVVGVILRYLAG
jgi:serine/threonine protein kinase